MTKEEILKQLNVIEKGLKSGKVTDNAQINKLQDRQAVLEKELAELEKEPTKKGKGNHNPMSEKTKAKMKEGKEKKKAEKLEKERKEKEEHEKAETKAKEEKEKENKRTERKERVKKSGKKQIIVKKLGKIGKKEVPVKTKKVFKGKKTQEQKDNEKEQKERINKKPDIKLIHVDKTKIDTAKEREEIENKLGAEGKIKSKVFLHDQPKVKSKVTKKERKDIILTQAEKLTKTELKEIGLKLIELSEKE
jgi:hypothetical protein